MPGLVQNNAAIQITFFGNILSSTQTLGINDIANIPNSELLPQNLVDRVNAADEAAGVETSAEVQSTLLNIQADDLQVTSVSLTDQEFTTLLKEKELSNLNEANQNFYQILTQQPNLFNIRDVNLSGIPNQMTSSKVILNWDFSNILLINKNVTGDNYVRYANGSNSFGILPYIKKIDIDISSVHSIPPSQWLNLYTFNIPDSNYNTDYYKQFIVNKFKNLTPSNDVEYILSLSNELFDIRVYGSNDALDYPTIPNRAILYRDCKFLSASTPSKPNLLNNYAISTDTISLRYLVNEVEIGENNLTVSIQQYYISFIQLETKSSSYINYSINNKIQQGIVPGNITSNENIDIELNNLRSGTKYNVSCKLKNDVNVDDFSEFSDINNTVYSKLPNSLFNTNLNINIVNNKKYIKTKNINGSNEIFINLKDNTHDIIYQNSNTQTIEISNPLISNQENEIKGFGKYIDNSQNLVSISYSINDISKQIIEFNGFTNTPENMFSNSLINNLNQFNFINNITINDMYSDISNVGFRLKGTIRLNNITSDISNTIGYASENPYIIKINYRRNADVNFINNNYIFDIYIDDFNEIPSFVQHNLDFSINSIKYNMGIPSVAKIDISFDTLLNNINSINKFINGDGKIKTILPIQQLSCNNSKNIIIDNTEITSDGNYSLNNNYIQTKTNNYYKNVNYTESSIIKHNNININYKLYNIFYNSGRNYQYSIFANHFCDYNSYKLSNSTIDSSILDLNLIDIYEFEDISLFNTDLKGILYNKYTDHTIAIKDTTLLHINGYFNTSNIYPNINDFSYNNITHINVPYNFSNISYLFNGFSTTNNNGYKWITLRIKKHNTNSFIFNGNNTKIINTELKGLDNTGERYIPFKNINNYNQNYKLFTENIINELSDINSYNVIGFVTCQTIDNDTMFSSFSKNFSKNNSWLTNGILENNKSFVDLFNYSGADANRWGSLINDYQRNQSGFYVDPNIIKDYLYINIAIKNNYSS
tara:strand:- start:5715 stop:8702 length:2988 start_codon:yes stop_codon:yes gene_type:complete